VSRYRILRSLHVEACTGEILLSVVSRTQETAVLRPNGGGSVSMKVSWTVYRSPDRKYQCRFTTRLCAGIASARLQASETEGLESRSGFEYEAARPASRVAAFRRRASHTDPQLRPKAEAVFFRGTRNSTTHGGPPTNRIGPRCKSSVVRLSCTSPSSTRSAKAGWVRSGRPSTRPSTARSRSDPAWRPGERS
jgi:hypothetical protein